MIARALALLLAVVVIPAATPLIEARGTIVTLAQARSRIVFTPLVPDAEIIEVALIPPLNVDRPQLAGIAFEYARDGDALLLSEWPGPLPPRGLHRPCAPAAASRGKRATWLWTTRSRLVMTLQPDGDVAPRRLADEARRLAAAACRARGG